MKKNFRLIILLTILIMLVACLVACNFVTDSNEGTDADDTKYAITFVGGDDATGTAPTMADQPEGAEITLPANTFSKENYDFGGWYDGTNNYQAGDEYTMKAEAVTFTVKWLENTVIYELSADESEYYVSGVEAGATYAVIRTTYNGKPVTSIGEDAFSGCSYLATVTFDENIQLESIGEWAFSGCSGLTSITIPSSVTSIEACTFYRCTELVSIIIPSSVTSIGDYVFATCVRLETINYSGTIAQWNAITKSNLWNSYTGNFTIHCTDGDISK